MPKVAHVEVNFEDLSMARPPTKHILKKLYAAWLRSIPGSWTSPYEGDGWISIQKTAVVPVTKSLQNMLLGPSGRPVSVTKRTSASEPLHLITSTSDIINQGNLAMLQLENFQVRATGPVSYLHVSRIRALYPPKHLLGFCGWFLSTRLSMMNILAPWGVAHLELVEVQEGWPTLENRNHTR